MKQSGILILAEHDNQHLKHSTANVVAAAKLLPGDITIVVAGYHCDAVVGFASLLEGVKTVLVADAPSFEYGLAENVADMVAELGKSFQYILSPATTYGKNILPRVAALLDVAQVSEITQIISEDTFVRPIYAGNVLATVQALDPIKVITIRPTAFKAVESKGPQGSSATITKLTIAKDFKHSQFIEKQESVSKRPELTSARVVIAGGRGLHSKENFKLLEAIADKLGGAVGASRAAVDAGFVSNDYQIGQTGKVVAPDLYIAVGISGAIQHLAGMKESKIIVAINKDPDAPVFQVADYGLVGDLFQILPELNDELAIQMGNSLVE